MADKLKERNAVVTGAGRGIGKAIAIQMAEEGARVVVNDAGQANYGAAKSGIAGFTRVVARDMGRYGVTCNAIAPRAWTRLTASIPQQRRQPQAGDLPDSDQLEQLAPDFVSPMTCYLASDHAWNVNGQLFMVYSGTVALLAHPLPSSTIFKHGMWTLDELSEMVPQMLEGTRNPAPPPDGLDIPGRPQQAPQTQTATSQ